MLGTTGTRNGKGGQMQVERIRNRVTKKPKYHGSYLFERVKTKYNFCDIF